MILSDLTIRSLVASGSIRIDPPLALEHIRPAGIRLHLGAELLLPVDGQVVDLQNPSPLQYRCQSIAEAGFALTPNQFVLASTHESIGLDPTLVGQLDGRSTVARLGLMIHCSSGVIDGNHDEMRSIVLEIKNIGNCTIVLHHMDPVAMLVIQELTGAIQQTSQSQYRNQISVTPPNLTQQLR